MKYRKKPIVVDVYHLKDYSNESVDELYDFVGNGDLLDVVVSPNYTCNCIDGVTTSHIFIKTLEGRRLARKGYYIIKGVHGEFYPCKPDIFEKTYEEVIGDDS